MMKKYSKKFISILLIMAMVMSIMPAMTITVNATTPLSVLWAGLDQSATCHQYGDYISNITFANINHNEAGTQWHYDLGATVPAGEVKLGQSYPISITVRGNTMEYQHLAVYVDWNQNNTLGTITPIAQDMDEQAAVWYGYTGSVEKTLTGSITIPTGIATGQAYMRVVLDADSGGANGGDFQCAVGYGEFQDYILNISENTAAPTFVGSTTSLTVDANSTATDVKSMMHVNDTEAGQTLTWSQKTAPNHGGTLVITSATASSGSTDITPGGTITYAPAVGFSGDETFTVQVWDGSTTALRTITVTVNPRPGLITEKFGDETDGHTEFVQNGVTFDITGGYLEVENHATWGLDDDYFIENSDTPMTEARVVGSIKSTNSDFTANSLYITTLNAASAIVQNNDILIRGKLDGVTKFTHTVTFSQINTTATNNYLTYINLSSYCLIPIDELEFEVVPYTMPTAPFTVLHVTYLMIDDFQFAKVATNVMPTLATINTLTSATEDTAYTISYSDLAAAADEADTDIGDTISFRIESITSGTLTKGGSAITSGTTTLGLGESLVWTPAANANGVLNAFTVKAYDGLDVSNTAVQVKISTAAVNDAPTDIALSASSINENATGNSSVGTLSTTDPDAGNTFTYSLVAGTGSIDNASFNISGNNLCITNSPNYETKSSYTVRVRATDQGNLYFDKAFTITINNVNEAPTDIALSASATNENVAGNSAVGALSTTDADAGNSFTYTLVAGTGSTDNASFNISGSNLCITNSPDFETKNSYSIRVRTTDQGSLYYEKVFVITINDLNEAPTDVALSASAINENVAGNSNIGTLSTTDPDAGNTFAYTLVAGTGSTDNASFNISGNNLRITSIPDYETKNSYSVRVRTTDQGSLSYEKIFVITINDLNEAPTDITLSASATNENVAGNATVGALSTTDADAGNTFTYSLVAGTGSTDNASFNISGSNLCITNSPDYETKNSYSIRVRTTDQGSLYFEKVINITINDVNEAPGFVAAGAGNLNVSYNAAATDIKNLLHVSDMDAGQTLTWTKASDASHGGLSVVGATASSGSNDVTPGGTLTYIPNAGYSGSDSFTIQISDGTSVATRIINVTVSAASIAPTVTTSPVSSIASTTATGNGLLTALGTPNPTSCGVCWNTTGAPTTANNKVDNGAVSTTGALTASMTGLTASTTYYVRAYATNTAGTSYGAVVSFTTSAAPSGGGSTPTPTSTPVPTATPTPTPAIPAVVEVDGVKQDAGTSNTKTTGGQTTTTITVDDTKLDKLLEGSRDKPTVTLPSTGSDTTVGELNGQTVKNMEAKEAILEIRTDTATYTLPASEINIDAVSAQLGSLVVLKDIKVSVSIAEPSADTVKIVEDSANKNSYQLVVAPVEFTITCTSGNKTIDVSKFNGYVERTIAIPAGVDPSKITTGLVVNPDGTTHHVPTRVTIINGKYYAVINSLTNSTYTVVWNPMEFADVSAHWAKDTINNMGSRMVVSGVGNNNYAPNKEITRGEFAAIIVKALGLVPGTGKSNFVDVEASKWYSGYIQTASAYGILTGYSAMTFGPNDEITREQAMTMIARAMNVTGLNSTLKASEVDTLLSEYSDGADASDFAKTSIAACLKTGIISGTGSHTIAPKKNITRAEVAVIIQKLLQKSNLI